MPYAELAVTTNFTFLTGASHPEEMVERATGLGLIALAITDRNTLTTADGPERLAPEWWWDDPNWRSGLRDYWRVETAEGPRLWMFHTPQGAPSGWWAHGTFA